jgi:hypothetical protein
VLLAHASALLRRLAVDVALDREQLVEAPAAIGALSIRARSKNLRRACAQHIASVMGPGLACGVVEPVEPGVGVRLHQARIAGQVFLGVLAAAVWGVKERRSGRAGPPNGRSSRT